MNSSHPVEHAEQFYNNLCEKYLEFQSEFPLAKYVTEPHAYDQIGNVNGKVILDCGCGNGKFIVKLSENKPLSITGVDISQEQINIAKNSTTDITSCSINLVQGDLTSDHLYKTLGEDTFDLIYSIWVVVHMESLDHLRKYFNNMYKSLKPGGTVLIYQDDFEAETNTVLSKLIPVEFELIKGKGLFEDGALIKVTYGDAFSYAEYYWSPKRLINIMNDVGFKNIERVNPYLKNENALELSEAFIEHKGGYFIRATK
jgi:ubiquinone/menaquinone biosynthesis C-methylase UbiE